MTQSTPATKVAHPVGGQSFIGRETLSDSTRGLIDTRPERLETHVSHGKQKTACISNRYGSQLTSAHVLCEFPGTRCVSAPLPETVNRVETRVSHRKQRVGHTATRHASRSPKLRLPDLTRAIAVPVFSATTHQLLLTTHAPCHSLLTTYRSPLARTGGIVARRIRAAEVHE
jgi:hypothetical protein